MKLAAVFSPILLASLILMSPLAARADSLPALTQYLQNEIARSGNALPMASDESLGASNDEYFFRRWLVRLQAQFGITVPWVAKFRIIPEVELVWQRSYPEGWTDYKP